MRVSFAALLPVVVSLTAWVASAHYDGGAPLEARDWLDDLTTRDLEYVGQILERREVLSEFSTRDLIDELTDRLERRGNGGSKEKTYGCPYCGKQYKTFDEAKACATQPAILGGCKVQGAVKQTSQSSLKSSKSGKGGKK
ncbi:hypothetical protein EST38_g8611 [Candolleomyces aberdarensis]|uniref:C2H2-type domain-containing protein n=1 Tax=Candolleomyces aberdarensis TaxID=2316362 RepID=A0A4Q2DE70_9AGAR|nr:hypothetical protein EST38_g8611 [Candolleomyces aberdarensis]